MNYGGNKWTALVFLITAAFRGADGAGTKLPQLNYGGNKWTALVFLITAAFRGADGAGT